MEKAFNFLQQHREVAFATVENNRSKLRVFQIMKQETGKLYFATAPFKQVYNQLQENPNVEILALHDNITVRVEGVVDFDIPEEIKVEIYESNEVLQRLYNDYTELSYFVLPIAAIDYFDLTPTPPTIEHYEDLLKAIN